jgi:hypothetical protein
MVRVEDNRKLQFGVGLREKTWMQRSEKSGSAFPLRSSIGRRQMSCRPLQFATLTALRRSPMHPLMQKANNAINRAKHKNMKTANDENILLLCFIGLLGKPPRQSYD